MRHIPYLLCSAVALVLLAGCQKAGLTGRQIRFTAVSQERTQTKTAYTGVKPGSVERIDWASGDVVRIYSDAATCSNNTEYHWADYGLSDISASGAASSAKLNVTSSQGGLNWGEGTHHFYGIYPSPGTAEDAATVNGASGNPFSGTIPAAQAGTATTVAAIESGANTTVYYPPMSSAYMVAYDARTESAGTSNLSFNPAYTAFHISAGRKDADITIHSVELIAGNTTQAGTALAGAFSTYNAGSGWVYTNPAYAATNNKLTFTFDSDDDIVLTEAAPTVEFVLFALPQNLTELTLTFNVDIEGVGTNVTRSLKLKTAEAITDPLYGHTYAVGDWLVFNACHKHYLKGLLVPKSIWSINDIETVVMEEGVADWTENDNTINYGSSPIVSASKLQGSNPYYFSLYAPLSTSGSSYLWKVTVLDGSFAPVTSGVTLTQVDGEGASTGNVSVEGVLTGEQPIAEADVAPVRFRVSGTSGTYYLSFSVVGPDGAEYSINSEVVRNSAGDPGGIGGPKQITI
jgi:hypothetical protein